MQKITLFTLAVTFFLSPAASPAGPRTDLSRFSLARGIPSDVFIAISERTNPERKFLNDYWSEVIQAFKDSGILSDVWDLITDNVPDEQIDEVEDIADRFGELCKKVDWNSLFEKEFAHAGRFQSGNHFLMYEGLIMGRSDPDKAQANYVKLKALFEELVKFALSKGAPAGFEIQESKRDGATVARLQIPDAPVSFSLAVQKDVILLSFVGDSILNDTLSLLNGTSKKKSLVDTQRFKSAFAQLPPAEDELVFFDIDKMLGTIRNTFTIIGRQQGPSGVDGAEGEVPPEAAVMNIFTTALNDLSIADYMASVAWTDGYRVFSDTVTTVKDGAKSSQIFQSLASGKPLRKYERFIPKEAESFSVSSGLNLSRFYDYVVSFISDNVPGGKGMIAHFNTIQKEDWKIDIKKDVLDLVEGSTVSASMGKDWIFMIKVTDEKKVEAQIDRLLSSLNELMGKENSLMINPVKIGGKGFRQLSHPMMMMMGGMSPPVIGCDQGHLIVGSSVKIVKTCLETAKGKHPNITASKRWKTEGLPPKGALSAVSFSDQSKMAQELQAGVGGLSMGLGMASMFAADAPPQVKKILSTIPPILAKLGPVLGKLDFYKSNASYNTFDGRKWYSRSVQNYKSPKERGEGGQADVQHVQAR